MNLARLAIEKKTITLVFTFILLAGGVTAFINLGRLEDPQYTIKQAVVYTQYPGASAQEVENEVTETLETEIQQLAQLKKVESSSRRGLSVITVEIRDQYAKEALQQIWDELRRKISAAQLELPPGAGPSVVNDDFGDVYGIFFAVSGDGYSYAEMKTFVDMLRRELLLVDQVAKVSLYGVQSECVYVEMSNNRMSQLGIAPTQIYAALQQKNLVSNAGDVRVGSEYIPIDLTGDFQTADQIGNMLISGGGTNNLIRLRDVAEIKRGYIDPATNLLRYDGRPAIGVGISIVPGGNVIRLGEAVKQKLKVLEYKIPVGMELNVINYQSELVQESVNGFLVNLLEAVIIVIVVLMIFMGLRSGLIIGSVLLLTIGATFLIMYVQGVNLQRISLGALVLALGMLVDNAIVVTEGILIQRSTGVESKEAAAQTVKQTAMPLLGATAVAILAFAALGLSKNSAGEFTRSLYQVMLYSLLSSWVLAVTVTPLLCHMFLKPKKLNVGQDVYHGLIFRWYRRLLTRALRFRVATILSMVVLLAVSMYGFQFVPKSFFPASSRPEFLVDYWLPEGTHIERTAADLREIEKYVEGLPGVNGVTTFIGQGSLRYVLSLAPEFPNSAYGQLKISVDDYRKIDELSRQVQDYIAAQYPDAISLPQKFALGPGEPGKIRARFIGQDPDVLRRLAEQALDVMRKNPNAKDLRQDWRQRIKVLRPVIADAQAERNAIGPQEVAAAIRESFAGRSVGIYRDGDDLLQIIVRPPDSERSRVDALNSRQIWSPAAGKMIPLTQVVSQFDTTWEDGIIKRINRERAIEAICDQKSGTAEALRTAIAQEIEAIPLPTGYTLEWGGEYEDSNDANQSVLVNMPLTMLLMVLIVIMLFNALRQPLIIFLCLPLAVIGVTAGLLASGMPLGFMAILGFISLTGMLIKNSVVLIDQIDIEIRLGKSTLNAIMDASVSRVRPVMMAAITTVLGMAPLLQDAFYSSMAVTIMSGLTFATILTLIVVPVLYAVFFRADPVPA